MHESTIGMVARFLLTYFSFSISLCSLSLVLFHLVSCRLQLLSLCCSRCFCRLLLPSIAANLFVLLLFTCCFFRHCPSRVSTNTYYIRFVYIWFFSTLLFIFIFYCSTVWGWVGVLLLLALSFEVSLNGFLSVVVSSVYPQQPQWAEAVLATGSWW